MKVAMANTVMENSMPLIVMVKVIVLSMSPVNASTIAPATIEKSVPTKAPINHSIIMFVI